MSLSFNNIRSVPPLPSPFLPASHFRTTFFLALVLIDTLVWSLRSQSLSYFLTSFPFVRLPVSKSPCVTILLSPPRSPARLPLLTFPMGVMEEDMGVDIMVTEGDTEGHTAQASRAPRAQQCHLLLRQVLASTQLAAAPASMSTPLPAPAHLHTHRPQFPTAAAPRILLIQPAQ